MVTTGVRHFKH